jgi:hypothetical protein
MHFLTCLIMLIGFAFVVCVGLVQVIWELSRLSFHESPVIREAPGDLAAAKEAKAIESYKPRPAELSDTH